VIRPRNEHTLAASCHVNGRGYWSGQEVCVRFVPAPAGTGIRFVRTDLPGRPSCSALTTHAADQCFRTNICRGDAKFAMIEHVMATLYALEIDNCFVEVDAEEMPGMDGSSIGFVDALRSVGLVVQAAARKRYIVDRPFRVEDQNCWIEAAPVADGHPQFEYHLDYGDDSPIVAQSYRGSLNAHSFCRELASARTFVTAHQVAQLQAQGVGGHVGPQDLLVFSDSGLIENTLRFGNECARHKTLDLVGDLALAGVDLIGRFVSHRGGHRLNAALARELAMFAHTSCMSPGRGSQFAPPIGSRRLAA
jgi:UDP-3-O-[3-hydroxymyristoyl] N-acetylglucosamine deacetylase